ncbi:protein draper [Folsomia candida]|uniref:protein draper n=1 Tax=Folsomia candida TaxID=158441 RepID=UPI00160524C0|nr:protein draper [Folsomia candida]
MNQIIKAQCLVLLILSVLNAVVSWAYLDYEAPCSPSDTENVCDPSKFLKCIDNTCLCNGTMVWDVKNVERCGLKLGQVCPIYPSFRGPFCYGTAVCKESDGHLQQGICTCVSPDEPSPNGEYCIHLAHNVGEYCTQHYVTCSTTDRLICSGTQCTCESGWLVNGTVCMAGFNSTCKVGSELPIETCRSNNLLKCNPETERCECSRGTDHIWHENTKICLTKAGATCEHDDFHHYECIEKASCRTGPNGLGRICTCNKYHHPSPDGTECVQDPVERILAPGELCDPENLVEVCNYAKDNVCSCPNKNFTCSCDCEKPFLINSKGECPAGFEAPCENLPNSPINLTCNEEAYLKCHQIGENSTCGCDSPLSQFYDRVLKTCQLRVGQECDPSPDKISCPETSICRKTDGDITRCWCEHSYKPSEDERRCYYTYSATQLPHGAACQEWNYLEFCPKSWNLFCVNGTCQCPEEIEGKIW